MVVLGHRVGGAVVSPVIVLQQGAGGNQSGRMRGKV